MVRQKGHLQTDSSRQYRGTYSSYRMTLC